ncbi:2-hydroxyisoflavanone dehydratase-like [Gastrolobium bilobum]|uniref:2-hydroxyisoflavanone dehydratase-like n=1 Tax=Gastrolobium bilobum TaxID=150636 RepID=UPI002AAF6F2D|nr:2-hydroxyisoflavanone dehydratase-like [Gastrolobium bilobum]
MASTEGITSLNIKKKEIVSQVPSFIYVYSDGSVERPRDYPRIPPSPKDPATGVSSKDVVFSNDPHLSARLFLPKLTQSNHNQKLSILVYFHGGAFCCESAFAAHHHKYCNIIASQGNVLIVSIEYRKAPQHFLPTGYDDCWAGLYWVASHATENPTITNREPWLINHGNFNKIFIGGDSSGGNNVHNIAMRAGVETLPGGVKLYGAYLNHPYFWGSKPIGSESVTGLEESLASLGWKFAYPDAPGGIDNPMINPLAPGAPSLATLGCSKMLVTFAGKDPFRDRTVLYCEAVKESEWEGEVQLFEQEEEEHVYYMFDPETEQAKRLIKVVADFLHQ